MPAFRLKHWSRNLTPFWSMVGDLDGDGDLDFATNNLAGLGAVVYFNDSLPPSADFRRGDANGDTTLDVADPIFALNALFGLGGMPSCEDAADANDDGTFDIADPVAILEALFVLGSPPLPTPGPTNCGPDPTPDALGCAVSPGC